MKTTGHCQFPLGDVNTASVITRFQYKMNLSAISQIWPMLQSQTNQKKEGTRKNGEKDKNMNKQKQEEMNWECKSKIQSCARGARGVKAALKVLNINMVISNCVSTKNFNLSLVLSQEGDKKALFFNRRSRESCRIKHLRPRRVSGVPREGPQPWPYW